MRLLVLLGILLAAVAPARGQSIGPYPGYRDAMMMLGNGMGDDSSCPQPTAEQCPCTIDYVRAEQMIAEVRDNLVCQDLAFDHVANAVRSYADNQYSSGPRVSYFVGDSGTGKSFSTSLIVSRLFPCCQARCALLLQPGDFDQPDLANTMLQRVRAVPRTVFFFEDVHSYDAAAMKRLFRDILLPAVRNRRDFGKAWIVLSSNEFSFLRGVRCGEAEIQGSSPDSEDRTCLRKRVQAKSKDGKAIRGVTDVILDMTVAEYGAVGDHPPTVLSDFPYKRLWRTVKDTIEEYATSTLVTHTPAEKDAAQAFLDFSGYIDDFIPFLPATKGCVRLFVVQLLSKIRRHLANPGILEYERPFAGISMFASIDSIEHALLNDPKLKLATRSGYEHATKHGLPTPKKRVEFVEGNFKKVTTALESAVRKVLRRESYRNSKDYCKSWYWSVTCSERSQDVVVLKATGENGIIAIRPESAPSSSHSRVDL